MIYDIHTHFWKKEELGPEFFSDIETAGGVPGKIYNDSEDFLDDTKAADRVVVFGLRALKTGFYISNDTVKSLVDMDKDRLVFFTSVDPAETGYMQELERTHQDLGAKGIKLGPIYQGVHPTDQRYHHIYAYAEKHGLPIITHMATTFSSGVPLNYANPIYMDEVAIEYPDLKIVLAHLGHPWTAETISLIRRTQNLYADIAALYYRPWQFYNTLRLLVEYGPWNKVFFGSDYPVTTTQESLDGFRNINHVVEGTNLPRIPEEVIEGIINQEAFSILGITG